MATTTIPWGDGSGDNIYLTYSASTGDQTVLVSSDVNGGAARQKVITFVSSVGNISRSLTVLQESNMDYVSITWNDVCITYNDTAIAYPYVEPYIVFADQVVEQVCATNWGDGTGIKPSQAAQSLSMYNAFNGNTNITSFDEFRYFTHVTNFTNAFRDSSLTKITLPEGIVIRNNNNYNDIFNGCTSLTEIDFSDMVRYLGDNAKSREYNLFDGCTALTTLRFTSLEQINSIPANFGWSAADRGDVPFCANNSTHYVYLNGDELRDLVIPATMTSITPGAFYRFNRLTSVTFPSTLTGIGGYAFRGCTSLTGSISVPATSIGNFVFADCPNIEELIFTATTLSIPSHGVDGTNVKRVFFPNIVTIPNSRYFNNDSHTFDLIEFGPNITSIGSWFFGTQTTVKVFVCRATTPPTAAQNKVFYIAPQKTYVPYSSDHSILNAYKTATNWSANASKIYELNSDGSIPT